MITIKIGDSRELIKTLPNKSIDCVVTSPPYWGLRDYKTEPIIFDGLPDCKHDFTIETDTGDFRFRGANSIVGNNKNPDIVNGNGTGNFCSLCDAWRGQLGLEPTPELFIKHLLDFFDDVKLKLKDEGNCFVNLGDTYGTQSGSMANGKLSSNGTNKLDYKWLDHSMIKGRSSITKHKCLCLIPQRFAIGMVDHGWILRNEIIWSKPNHMPESVTDRLTKSHEVIYHFVKQQKYYYNLDAIREPHKWIDETGKRIGSNTIGAIAKIERFNYKGKFDGRRDVESFSSPRARTQRKHQIGDGYRQGMNRDESNISIQRVHEVNQPEIAEFLKEQLKDICDEMDTVFGEHKWRHWIRTDESGASLPSPEDWKYLKDVVAPWLPNTFDEIMLTVKDVPQVVAAHANGKNPGDVWTINTQPYKEAHFATFPLELVRRPILAGCPPHGTVLDLFAGSGTVGEFCRHNERNAILFELNPDYNKLIQERTLSKIPQLTQYI